MKKKPRVVVVLGSHRCGTSVSARALQVLDVPLGSRLMPAVPDVNPLGFFEDLDVVEINAEMLAAIGMEWSSIRSVGETELQVLRSGNWVARACELLRDKLDGGRRFGFKDPRTALLLPVWREAIDLAGLDASFVVSVRDPLSAAKSLLRRDGMALDRGMRLWLQHYAHAVRGVTGAPHVFVDYDRLLDEPRPQLARLGKSLGLPVDEMQSEAFVSQFVDSGMRHSRHDADEIAQVEQAPALAETALRWLLERADASASGRSVAEPAWVAQVLQQDLSSFMREPDFRPAAAEPGTSRTFLQVFTDTGTGFNEAQSLRFPVTGKDEPMQLDVPIEAEGCVALRVDPYSGPAVVRVEAMAVLDADGHATDMLPGCTDNADLAADGLRYFSTEDPQIVMREPADVLAHARTLRLRLRYEALDVHALHMCKQRQPAAGSADGLQARIEELQTLATSAETRLADAENRAADLLRQLQTARLAAERERRERADLTMRILDLQQATAASADRLAAEREQLHATVRALTEEAVRRADAQTVRIEELMAARESAASRIRVEEREAERHLHERSLADAVALERVRAVAERLSSERDDFQARLATRETANDRLAAQIVELSVAKEAASARAAAQEQASERRLYEKVLEIRERLGEATAQSTARIEALVAELASSREQLRQAETAAASSQEQLRRAETAAASSQEQLRQAETAAALSQEQARRAENAAALSRAAGEEKLRSAALAIDQERVALHQSVVQERAASREVAERELSAMRGAIELERSAMHERMRDLDAYWIQKLAAQEQQLREEAAAERTRSEVERNQHLQEQTTAERARLETEWRTRLQEEIDAIRARSNRALAKTRRVAVEIDLVHARRQAELARCLDDAERRIGVLNGQLADHRSMPFAGLVRAATRGARDSGAEPEHSVDSIVRHDGEAFVRAAYAAILGRAPDARGLAHYLRRMESGGDKFDVLDQLGRSAEAGLRGRHVAGMEAVHRSRRRGRRGTLRTTADALSTTRTGPMEGAPGSIELASVFDWAAYLHDNPDVAKRGKAAWEHFLACGWQEERQLFPAIRREGVDLDPVLPVPHSDPTRETTPVDEPSPTLAPLDPAATESGRLVAPASALEAADATSPSGGDAPSTTGGAYAYFLEPVHGLGHGPLRITRLMKYLWDTRPDLQAAFDLNDSHARTAFCKWYLLSAAGEYKLPRSAFEPALLEELARGDPECAAAANALPKESRHGAVVALTPGANLVGYAAGEFGMGEHLRSIARGLAAADTEFGVQDVPAPGHGGNDTSVRAWMNSNVVYDTNMFGINADVLPSVYFSLGAALFEGRYNIGLWAWELEDCPPQFDLAFRLVDEVWANSEFCAQSLRRRSPVPVHTLPLAVSAPDVDAGMTKAYFGLPDAFTFLFSFDAVSYMDRKNPIAVVRAFRQAFGDGDDSVHLVLKTMNTDRAGPLWQQLVDEAAGDIRITVLDRRLTKDEVRGLTRACDAYVSLHRSEGFGFGVAEAMAYGRPVICTNYSGTREFATEETACVVDYTLIPVAPGAYPFGDGQRWANPDVGQAAAYMRRLRDDRSYREHIAAVGQRFVLENLSDEALGRRYAARLDSIRAERDSRARPPEPETAERAANADAAVPMEDDELAGSVDRPSLEAGASVSDDLVIEGWAASTAGIRQVEVSIDGCDWGRAHLGLLRPDIHAAFPEMADAARAGYMYQRDLAGLEPGVHRAVIRATSRSGKSLEWAWEFVYRGATRYTRWIASANEAIDAVPLTSQGTCTVIVRSDAATDGGLAATLQSLAAQTCGAVQVKVSRPSRDWRDLAAACTTDILSIIDAGDVFQPWAVSVALNAFRSEPALELAYGDCDHFVGGTRANPLFKPAWSPIFLDTFNYVGKPWFAKAERVRDIVEAEPGDLTEHRLVQALGLAHRVCHIPAVMLSVAGKPPRIEPIRFRDAANAELPRVCVVIPTRFGDLEIVERCFQSLVDTDYPSLEVVVIVNNPVRSVDPAWLRRWPFKFLAWDHPFNWSAVNNYGARQAGGDLLAFLNDDVESLHADWLRTMVQTLQRTGAGAVGAHLLYPNSSIQHMGVNLVPYGGGTRHLLRFCLPGDARLLWLTTHPREVSAVTGACLLTPRSVFDAMQGFDESYPLICNDVDYCLRLQEQKLPVVVEPRARLTHHEGVSRAGMAENSDSSQFWDRWGALLRGGDPYSNPNLDEVRDDWAVRPQAAPFTFRFAAGLLDD